MKVILCNTPKGQYAIPLKLIAEDRANYYSVVVDGNEVGLDEFNEEVNFVMEDNFEGIDWLINNFNWEDWESTATKINDKVKVTDDDFWTSSEDFEIVDINLW
jgi:hypothetical protein